MKDKKLLLIFVKNPERGKVKTRLAQTVGNEKAYQIYLKLLDYTFDVAEQVKATKQIWYSTFIDESSDGSAPPAEKRLQQGEDLGKRMEHAFKEGFRDKFEKVVVIGSDCPEISPKIIEEAFIKLDQKGAVIGPSEDGGYYLLGLKGFIPEIFEGISWSTDQVFSETVNILKQKKIHYSLLPTLNDIDTEEDLRKSDFE